MGKAHPFSIRHQLIGQLAVAQPEIVVGVATPGAQVNFINRDWRIKLIRFFALFSLHNLFRQTANKRRGFRAHLRFEGIRVGLQTQVAIGINHLVFIELTVMRPRDKQFPDSALFTQAHRMTATVPVVELPNHRDPTGVWSPDRKTRTCDAIHSICMRA